MLNLLSNGLSNFCSVSRACANLAAQGRTVHADGPGKVSSKFSQVRTYLSSTCNGVSYMFLSVVVPIYNEEEVLPEFHRRIVDAVSSLAFDVEILYVNDGSTDNTLLILQDLYGKDPRVAVIDVSRNFGKEIALTAGL